MIPRSIRKYVISDKWDFVVKAKTFKKLVSVHRSNLTRNNEIGKLCEIYARDRLEYSLRLKGLEWSFNLEPMTYNIRTNYRKSELNKNGDNDIFLRIIDEKGNVYHCNIEVSNWKPMLYVSDYSYKKNISNKFKTYDPKNRNIHILFITKENINLVKDRCARDGIIVHPVAEFLTPEFINLYLISDRTYFPLSKRYMA